MIPEMKRKIKNLKEPRNYAYWRSIIEDGEKAAEFMVRGNERQKKELIKAFKYMEYLKSLSAKDMFETKKK